MRKLIALAVISALSAKKAVSEIRSVEVATDDYYLSLSGKKKAQWKREVNPTGKKR